MIGRFIKELRRRQVFGVAVIYIAATWVLLQVVDVTQDEVPVDVRLILIAAIIGLPIALIAGWLYDITRKGVFRTAPVSADESFDSRLGAKDFTLLGVLAAVWVAGIYVAYAPPAKDRSIAVLPFENRSHDPDSEIIAFGVRDDLNAHLGRIGALRVIASSSVDQIDQSLPVDRIGEQLGVAFLLKGSIDRVADRIRINVTLIESAEATQSWSGSFDRELSTEGLFDIRSGIAEAITSGLKMTLTENEQEALHVQPTQVLTAWQAFMRGRYAANQRTGPHLENAVREFEKAVELDPKFAAAHAELAIAYLLLIREYFGQGYGTLDDDEGKALAELHVVKAMQLGPELAEAHAAKGALARWRGDGDAALASLRRSIEINPNYANAYNWMAIDLGRQGQHDETFAMLEEGLLRDPLSIVLNLNYLDGLALRMRLDEANAQLENLATINEKAASIFRKTRMPPGDRWADLILGWLELTAENDTKIEPANKLQWYLDAIGLKDEALRIAGDEDRQILVIKDRKEVADWLRENNVSDEIHEWYGFDGAYVFSYVGMIDEVRPILEEIWQNTSSGYHFYSINAPETYLMEALVAVRRDADDEKGAREILDFMQANVGRYRSSGIVQTRLEDSVDYQEGVMLYMAGDRRRGLTLMAQAADDGYFMYLPATFQDAMYQEPEFVRILEKQSVRANRERKKFLAVVCNDNPYAAVWQPMDVTCDNYFAALEN